MTIKERLMHSYAVIGKRLFGIGREDIGMSTAIIGGDKADPRTLMGSYHGIVYRAIKTIAQATGKYEPELCRMDGKKETDVVSHPFLNLLYKPNKFMSQTDLFSTHQTFKEMFGEVFWYMVLGDVTGQPKEIYLIRPDKMTVNLDDQGNVIGYTMRKSDGSTIPFTENEILHDKDFNPNNPYRGYGTLEAALDYVATEDSTAKFTKNFFINNAGVNGVLTLKGMSDKNAFRKFVEQWRAKYEGVDNAGKTAILREMDSTFTKVGLGLNDIDMSALRQMTIDEVLMMFSVPRGMLGLSANDGGLGRASVETLEYIFAKSIDNKMEQIDSFLERAVNRYYPKDKLYVEHECIVPEDKEYELKERQAAVDMWMTRNEARLEEGLDVLPGGDVLRAPINVVPLEFDATPSANAGKRITLKLKAKKKDAAELTYEKKENFRLMLQRHQMRYERVYLKAVMPILDEQESQAMKVAEHHGAAKTLEAELFALATAIKEFDQKLYPVLADMYLTQGALALAFAGADDNTNFDITPAVEKFIHDSTKRMAKNYNEQTLGDLAKTLTEGINLGESVDKLKKRVAAVYVETKGYRAERISRTETLKATNNATNYAYKQTGFVKAKEWFCNPGACEFCLTFDGKQFGLDDTFASIGEQIDGKDGGTYNVSYDDIENPPLHPNCRCTIIPVR